MTPRRLSVPHRDQDIDPPRNECTDPGVLPIARHPLLRERTAVGQQWRTDDPPRRRQKFAVLRSHGGGGEVFLVKIVWQRHHGDNIGFESCPRHLDDEAISPLRQPTHHRDPEIGISVSDPRHGHIGDGRAQVRAPGVDVAVARDADGDMLSSDHTRHCRDFCFLWVSCRHLRTGAILCNPDLARQTLLIVT
ncbi:MAG: hypothetical protein ACOYLQ_20445 [Hyphomicrobiaceae bacterium]